MLVDSNTWMSNLHQYLVRAGITPPLVQKDGVVSSPQTRLFLGVTQTQSTLESTVLRGEWELFLGIPEDPISDDIPRRRLEFDMPQPKAAAAARKIARRAGWHNGMAHLVFLALILGTKWTLEQSPARISTSEDVSTFDAQPAGTTYRYRFPYVSEDLLAAIIFAAWQADPFLQGGDLSKRRLLATYYAACVVELLETAKPLFVQVTGGGLSVPGAAYPVVLE